MDTKTFFKNLDGIKNLPTLPIIAMEVSKMLQDNTSINTLSETIEKDHTIAARVLKLINSAFFGVRSQVDSISDAVVLLGYNSIRNLVVSVSVVKAFSGIKTLDDFDITDFWKHSIAVAITSRHLSQLTHLDRPGTCFTGGLLHDIGKVVLAQFFRNIIFEILSLIRKENLSFHKAEKRISPVGHAEIGAYVAERWILPENLLEIIKYHHIINKSSLHIDLVMVIHVANAIVNSFTSDSIRQNEIDGKLEISKINTDAIKVMQTHLDTVTDWFPPVLEEVEKAHMIFVDKC